MSADTAGMPDQWRSNWSSHTAVELLHVVEMVEHEAERHLGLLGDLAGGRIGIARFEQLDKRLGDAAPVCCPRARRPSDSGWVSSLGTASSYLVAPELQ